MSSETPFQAVVAGAGISGLVCAYRLARAGVRTAIVECEDRVGGMVFSEQVNGFLLERGPNSFASSPGAIELLSEIGLSEVAEVQPMRQHDRYVWRCGKLHRVPTGPMQMVSSRLLSFREKMQILRGLKARLQPPITDVTLGSYCRERLGNGAVDALLKPGIAGIFAADADRISLQAILSKVYPVIQRHERLFDVLREMKQRKQETKSSTMPRSLVSFPAGLSTLTDRLRERFIDAGGKVISDRATGIERDPETSTWKVALHSGAISAEHVILALPSDACESMLRVHSEAAANLLREIEYAPMAIVHVGIKDELLRESRPGFGFLTVRDHGVRALGMIWSDRVFHERAPAGQRLLTCFYGGEIDPGAMELDDQQLRTQLVTDLRTTMRLTDERFDLFQITRLARAIPIMRVGHVERMQQLKSVLPDRLHLLGNFTDGVSIPDRIDAATRMASKIFSSASVTRSGLAA